ncbi:N-acetylglucosamine/diacetylchitobiose ABC transporter substrate-binding protein [Streptomyces pathocidini]|uniref:N-acetylglucosamine/diacetylchitobiose ABC transporter substrate-binding protein n=1 Tax=Streptomyces pathocidini TaxID=1650571 RepID=A0ABW7UNW3_9ACTN|nr:N-acetylglucosamine/diacetylchitobiose ABC transporter substrate-binding protein [Streptomyces pathocidini]
MSSIPDLGRRDLLKGAIAAGATLAAGAALSGCAMGGGSDDSGPKTAKGKRSADNPFGVVPNSSLELVWFKGGSPLYLADAVNPLFKRKFPKATLKQSSSERLSQTLQPRFVGGNPPDYVDNAGADALDFGALIQDGQVLDLTELYEAPSIDDPDKKVKDTLLPGAYENAITDGKPYALSYFTRAFGLWYNAQLFEKEGWEAPTTWDDFLALCKELKKAGITPYGFAGKNAADYHTTVLLASAAKIGGHEVITDIDNLEDGAWKSDAVIQAADAWAEIGAKYTSKSFKGLIHTEVQLRQNQGKLAFYPSGDWLESEQKEATTKDFTYAMMPVPSVTTADALPAHAIYATVGGGWTFIPAKAKNAPAALEYMRMIMSREGAQAFTKASGWLTTVQGGADGVELPPGMAAAQKAIDTAAKDNSLFETKIQTWYRPLSEETKGAVLQLMFEGGTGRQFAERMQKKADEIKKDSSVKKYKR